MDEYSCKTVALLLERHPKYLGELLTKLGIDVDVSTETPESISAMIAYRKPTSDTSHESSIYTCQCGSNSIVAREVQNRSSDEGSTIVYICTSCGKQNIEAFEQK